MVAEKLPDNWKTTTLGEIADLAGGGTPSRDHPEYFTGDIVWLTPTEIPRNRVTVISNSREKISQEGLKKSSARLLPKGTVLMTSRASIGYVAIAGSEVTTNQGFASFICKEAVYNHYLAYWLLGNADYFIEQATGTTFKEIIKSKLRNFTFPLPPLPEQERIVERIESLFTQLDAGVSALKRSKAALKRYKASVLKAACEGRLVPQDPLDDSAEEMLRKLGKKPLVKNDFAELPQGWCWALIGTFIRKIQYGTSDKANEDTFGIPVLRMGNIVDGQLDFSKLKYLPKNTPGLDNLILEPGDLLFNRTNSAELVGKTAIYRKNYPTASFASYLIRVQPHSEISPDYISYCINSTYGRQYIKSVVSQQVGQANVNGTKLANMPVPLPPSLEQQRIVAEVERRLSVVQELEQAIAANLKRAGRLRQAILRQAFEGRLIKHVSEVSTM